MRTTRVVASKLKIMLLALTLLTLVSGCATPEESAWSLPGIGQIESVEGESGGPLQIIALLTALTLIPAVLMMASSFTRIIIVLSFIRNAMGMPQTPPNQVLLGLAIFLTVFVMAPVWQGINNTAIQPYLRNEIDQDRAVQLGTEPMRSFMFKQTREKDLSLFIHMAKLDRPRNSGDVPTHVLIPAFVISELKTAFQMGFLILVPFLIIDMVVSSALMSMGMVMLPPAVISLPFKILLFVLVDGWHLIIKSLMVSFA